MANPNWPHVEGYDPTKPCCTSPYCQARIEAERRAAWEAVNALIKNGPVSGNGCDDLAQRNGLILAANILMERMRG